MEETSIVPEVVDEHSINEVNTSINSDSTSCNMNVEKFLKPSMEYSSKWLAETDFSNAIPFESESVGEVYDTDETSSLADSDVKALAIDHAILLKKYSLTELLHKSNGGHFVDSSGSTFKDITVENSEKVYIGNVTNINIYKVKKGKSKINNSNLEETIKNEPGTSSLNIIPRKVWLEYKQFKDIPKFVIISHTATSHVTEQEDNMSVVRDIHYNHVSTKIMQDIAYNFLIGNDGNVYDGRGWSRIGAHTFRYNRSSIGIAFIGTFIDELPTEHSIQALWALIELGRQGNHIAKDYKLLAHSQCTSSMTTSGIILEIIKKHPHWEPNPVKPEF